MKFEGTLASVCDYLEISQVFNERVREFLPRIVVTGIECDSRRVTKGTIYYAKKGAHYNPFDHIEEIKQKGAVAILIDAPEDQVSGFPLETIDADKAAAGEALKSSNYEPNTETKDTLSRLKRSGYCVINKYQSNQDLAVSDYHATDDSEEARIIAEAKMLRIVLPRGKSLSGLAGFIYGNPSEKLRLIGVTGTNGKSTITNLIAQMLNKCGHKCAVFGTLGYGFVDNLQKSANTTMDAISLQRELASFVEQGADYAVLEVSSIGYCEGRVAGLSFYAGAFSNLSRDHLDYHETMEDYFCSKLNFLRTIPPARLVLNCKNDVGKRYAETISGAYQVNLGLDDVPKSLSHMLNIKRVSFKPSSLELLINTSEKKTSRTNLNLLGYFNAENYAVALGVLLSMGYDIKHLMRITPELKPITGRMECFSGADKPRLIVDYAHTPDGVEQALKAAQYHNQGEGRIFSIVGCGGDRDSGKRPLMAMKASVYSDYAIFTADNPRSEPLDLIIDDMMMAIDSNAAESAVRKAEDLYDNLKLFVNDLIVTKKADKLGLLSPNQLSKVKSAIDGTLLTEVKNSFKLIEQFEQQENAIDGFSSEGVFLKAISVFEKAVAKLKEVFSFEEYDDIRIKSDKSIVNVEERADYYEAHKESFAIPAMLPPASRADRNVIIVHDRYQAIRFAFEHANKNDCVVIAGKGHEDYQIFPDKTIHFSDREICCELLGIKQDTKTNSNSDKPAKQSKKPVTKAKAKASSTKATAAKKPATKAASTKATATKAASTKATAAKKPVTTKAASTKATAAKKPATKVASTKATAAKKPATKTAASKATAAKKPATKTAASKATAAKKVATTKAAASKATAAKKTTATKATTAKKPVTKASASKNSVKSAAKTAARKAAPSAKKSTSESSK
ncbi:Mur ligase family protein [Anaerobiospirillum succiniciproducens]|uniref:Mur ligase family protein n=1 Tax=Anaerobiospirillum succiniciproducens TaxID=13335 RepID=UPI000428F9E8|nr:UDP-N-acetylmuramoyl-L-alanyl-D-glutamate--2,6-diaminopimelate ligase [Anaerobiospirillum succiniciproducens]